MIEQLAEIPNYEAYKDSGVEWLGEIPVHWEFSKLGNCLKSVSVKNRPDLPLLSITREKGVITRNVENEEENHNYIPDDLSNYKVLKKGQFGMNKMKAWQGSYGVSDFTGIVSPAYFIFGFTKAIDPKFFHLAIRSRLYISFFGGASDGVRIGQWDLSKSRMKEIPFLIPTLPEQSAIADFLDRKTAQIDQAVAIKEQQIALLKERKQILIQNAVTRGLDPNVTMRNSGVDWIGEIPAHWNLKKLKYIVRFVSGGTPSKDRAEYWNGIIPWVSPKDMKRLNIDYSIDYITDAAVKNTNIRLLDVGTILIVVRGMILAKKVPVALSKSLLTINQDMKGLIPSPDCLPEYLLYLLDGINGVLSTLLEESGHGTKTLPTEKLGLLPLGIPSKDDQSLIVTYIETQSAKINQAIAIQQQQIDKLKEYKATLINSAVTGKIRVPEVAA